MVLLKLASFHLQTAEPAVGANEAWTARAGRRPVCSPGSGLSCRERPVWFGSEVWDWGFREGRGGGGVAVDKIQDGWGVGSMAALSAKARCPLSGM